jgi:hypothetical protein
MTSFELCGRGCKRENAEKRMFCDEPCIANAELVSPLELGL